MLNRNRVGGYLLPGMAIGLVVLSIACIALWKVAGSEREARATAESAARQWQATAKECSDATERASNAAQAAQKRSKAALEAAKLANKDTEAEINRLRQSSAGTCVEAVKTVREGLK